MGQDTSKKDCSVSPLIQALSVSDKIKIKNELKPYYQIYIRFGTFVYYLQGGLDYASETDGNKQAYGSIELKNLDTHICKKLDKLRQNGQKEINFIVELIIIRPSFSDIKMDEMLSLEFKTGFILPVAVTEIWHAFAKSNDARTTNFVTCIYATGLK